MLKHTKNFFPVFAAMMRFGSLLPDSFWQKTFWIAAAVRGLGAGSGWDLASEAAVAARIINATNPVILDAGAHRGDWSLLLNRQLLKAGKSPRFYLLEPSPTCLDVLRKLPKLQSPEFHIRGIGLGKQNGFADLLEPTPGSLLSSFLERRDSFLRAGSFQASRVRVQMTTVDDFLKAENLQVVDFLKLDIEGLELDALHGARGSLVARKIRALSFEFGSANLQNRTQFRDFYEFFQGLQANLYRIRPGGKTESVLEYTEDLEFYRGSTNYVCVFAG